LKQDEAEELYANTAETALRAILDHIDQRLRSPYMPLLTSQAAYFKDVMKKVYASTISPPAVAPPSTPAAPATVKTEAERLHWIREL
jgi:hypothetical protein